MLAGLLLASLSTMTMRSALFQRKSRTGWLEELDGIREEALDLPDDQVTELVDTDDIWTDLREGGEYADPHEISSLYATDETPDLPKPRAKVKPTARPTGRAGRSARRSGKPELEVAEEAPPPPPPVPITVDPTVQEEEVWTAALEAARVEPMAAGSPTMDGDQIWVQPAPHPMRPNEMWHPAEGMQGQLGEEQAPEPAAASAASADVAANADRSPFEAELEAKLIAAAERTVLAERGAARTEDVIAEAAIAGISATEAPAIPPPDMAGGSLVRRNRRDRPAPTPEPVAVVAEQAPEPAAAPVAEAPVSEVHEVHEPFDVPAEPAASFDHPVRPLDPPFEERMEAAAAAQVVDVAEARHEPVDPGAGGPDLPPLAERGDVSPLPSAPLPPAALPSRSPKPARDVPAFEDGPAFDPAALVTTPEEVAAPSTLAVAADGTIAVPGTIVRIGGARKAGAQREGDQAVVVLSHGWAWVSPGDGAASPVRIDLPIGRMRVEPGGTALAVAEGDGSAFVIVAAGAAELSGPGGSDRIERGTIVMIGADGSIQADRASDEEIEGDPVVAENLALDAEL